MASTSQTHPTFPSRPYSSTLHSSSKLPDRSAPLGFGASSHTHTAREAARQERERQERERAAAQQAAATTSATASNTMTQLTDEQRDEINEAVPHPRPSYPPQLSNISRSRNSSASSTSTKTNSSTITNSKLLSKPSASTFPNQSSYPTSPSTASPRPHPAPPANLHPLHNLPNNNSSSKLRHNKRKRPPPSRPHASTSLFKPSKPSPAA
jgi:hypothetical protein